MSNDLQKKKKTYMTSWNHRTLAAYTWTRAGKGPFNDHIGKAAPKACPSCNHHTENGDHLVWDYPRFARPRMDLRGVTAAGLPNMDIYR